MHSKASSQLLSGLVMTTIILFAQTAFVAAANDQGLQWGIDVGDRFGYHVELQFISSTANVSVDNEMYVIVNELSTIPEHATELADLTIFGLFQGSYTTYWHNGTVMDSLWVDVSIANPFVVYPIGNWSLLTQVFEDAAPAVTTQTSDTINYSLVDYPVPGNVHETVFLKSSGVPISHLYIRTWDSGTSIFMNLTLLQTQVSTYAGPIIILSGTVACVVLLAIVVLRRR